jgi:hypothetical protein
LRGDVCAVEGVPYQPVEFFNGPLREHVAIIGEGAAKIDAASGKKIAPDNALEACKCKGPDEPCPATRHQANGGPFL